MQINKWVLDIWYIFIKTSKAHHMHYSTITFGGRSDFEPRPTEAYAISATYAEKEKWENRYSGNIEDIQGEEPIF